MARITVTRLIDDLDGASAAQTIAFGLSGTEFEIDLSDKNASRLRDELARRSVTGRS